MASSNPPSSIFILFFLFPNLLLVQLQQTQPSPSLSSVKPDFGGHVYAPLPILPRHPTHQLILALVPSEHAYCLPTCFLLHCFHLSLAHYQFPWIITITSSLVSQCLSFLTLTELREPFSKHIKIWRLHAFKPYYNSVLILLYIIKKL